MSIDQPLTFSRDASRPSLLRYGVHHELEDLPGRIDAVHHGVAFTREAGHADMEPFHLAVTGRGLPQLFLVHLALIQTVDDKHAAKLVGGDGSAVATRHVALPGLLCRGILLEEGERPYILAR